MTSSPTSTSEASSARRIVILDAAIGVFGRLGFRKTSMDDLAAAADISRQGLYLHFASKGELLAAAVRRYLERGLKRVEAALARRDVPLLDRLVDAVDAWFGTHMMTFGPDAIDIIEFGRTVPNVDIEQQKEALRALLAGAIAASNRRERPANVCTPDELAAVLFTIGLTWKDYARDRAAFRRNVALCARACCQLPERL